MIPKILTEAITRDRLNISSYIKNINNAKVCEVGVRFGNYFKLILTENVEIAVAVDPWRLFESQECDPEATYTQQDLDIQYETFKTRYAGDARVTIERTTSLDAAAHYENEYFDFIYIDGNHTYKHCKNDLNVWWGKVKRGGILSGHDYINIRDFGVIQAVEEFNIENKISSDNFFVNSEEYASYYIFKE